MASPTSTFNAIGAFIAAQTIAAAASFAALLDASAKIEAQLTARCTTGGTVAATAGLKAEAYYTYGQTSLGASAATSATSLAITSSSGFAVGQRIIVENEVVTVSAVSGTTLTISALLRAHASGAAVYLIEQVPTETYTLGATAASTTYSKTLYLSTGKYIVLLTNTDASNAVTAEATTATVDGIS
jgi:hypothetical protein